MESGEPWGLKGEDKIMRYRKTYGRVLSDAQSLRAAAAFCLVLGLTTSGCVSAPVYRLKPMAAAPDCVQPVPDREVLVGLSVSGGGS